MGKRFIKFRVSRVIPSFQSCRSKDPSSLPANPVPSLPRLAPATANAIAALKLNHQPSPSALSNSRHHQSSIKRHVSSAFFAARRSFLGSRQSSCSSREVSHTESALPLRFQWGKDPKWHVIAKIPDYNYHYTPPRRKIYTSAASDNNENDVVLFPPLPLKNRRRRARRRRRTFQKVRISTSSDSGMIFSEDDVGERENKDQEDETDTLVSTGTDDSTTTPHRRSNTKAKQRKKKTRSELQFSQEEGEGSPATAPARLSEFMRRIVPCKVVEGKVRESFAVVKRSADPYEDFKRSMAEMVVEKQMFEAAELEELLRCFLSLNSDHHHGAIVRAFSEIWEALFCQS